MPFQSQAQATKMRKLNRDGKISDETLAEWEAGTDWENLPERVHPKRRERKSRPRTRPRRKDRTQSENRK